jgi:recombination protein RecA
MNEERFKTLDSVGKALQKQFDCVMLKKLGDKVNLQIPSIPTGLPSLDYRVLGCGGIPKGRIIEIYGQESAGKTALSLHIIAQCQKQGGIAAFIDAEHAFDPTFANTLGVDVDNLYVSQPDYGEAAMEVAIALVESKAVDLIVVDSVSALVPKSELEGEMTDASMGTHARLMSKAMRKLIGICNTNQVAIIFINQIRMKIGVMFGNPEETTGGRALKFFSSVRLEVRRMSKSDGGELKVGDAYVGHRLRIKNIKNKVGSPFNNTVVDLLYDRGFDTKEDVIEYAASVGLVTLGAWCTVKGDDNKYRRPDLTDTALFDTIKLAVEKTRLAAQETHE